MKILGTPEEVRERHGVTANGYSNQNAIAIETDRFVRVRAYDGTSSTAVDLTPDDARALARWLRRVAYRVEARQ